MTSIIIPTGIESIPSTKGLVSEISEEIIEGCTRRNEQCQRIVYEHYYKKMYAVCLRYSGDSDEAKDLLHDGFIKLFDKMTSFRDFSSFDGWMRKLFTNHCLDFVRSAYKKYIVYQPEFTEDETLDTAHSDLDFNESYFLDCSPEQLMGAMAKLRPDYRIILNLYAIENYSHQQIAEALGIKHATSRSKLQRARASLKKILKSK